MTHHTDAERAEFERTVADGMYGGIIGLISDHWDSVKGEYKLFQHQVAWIAWQSARRAPAAPVPQGWIDPNDKAQKQYLPHIGDRVLFKHDGRVYLGKHTGGSFKAEYPFGKTFGTWDCMWMYPSALDAAAPQPPEAGCSVSNGETQAAPVQLPEHTTSEHSKPRCGAAPKVAHVKLPEPAYFLRTTYDAGATRIWFDTKPDVHATPVYTEQQVRQLLAAEAENGK